jgi:O-antigen/teichoic acid export membrane protein
VAPLATPLVFGDQWRPSAPLIQALSLIAIAGAPYPFFVPLMTATGHTNRLAAQGGIHLVLCLLLTVAAAPFGLLAVAYGQVARASIMTILALWTMRETVGISFRMTEEAMRPALLSSVVMVTAMTWVAHSQALDRLTGWSLLIAWAALGAASYFATLLFVFFRTTVQGWIQLRAIFAGSD